MKISEVPLAVLRFHYQLARFPLRLIEDQVVNRIPTEAPARLLYERSLGMLDSTVGSALGDETLAKRGAALVERTDTLGRAGQLDAQAAVRKAQADAKLRSARDEAIQEREEAQNATQQEVKEARIGAAQRKQTVESAKRQVEDRAHAAEKAAAKASAAKLDEAEDKLGEAAQQRAEADRVAQLAAAEKRQHQEERAND
ncbi:IF2 family translation initiation factor [Mycobacterium sp. MUNTM1]